MNANVSDFDSAASAPREAILDAGTPTPARRARIRLAGRHLASIAAAVVALAAPTAGADSHLINFSANAETGSGSKTLIVGFSVSGDGDTFLLRAVGPTLKTFGVADASTDTRLSLYEGSTVIASNDNWGGAFTMPSAAFPLPSGSLDAALLQPLDHGVYTLQVGTAPGAAGSALAEIYDMGAKSGVHLSGLSARAQVDGGAHPLVAGFTIDGDIPRMVLLRAVGPSLADFGVSGVLNDPKLEVFEGGMADPSYVNDNWSGATAVRTAMDESGAFPLLPSSKDSAMLVNLAPGTYTARVTGADGGSGVALLELYDNPVSLFPLRSANNVIYQHGDHIDFAASGGYTHADGSKTEITGGWLRLEIFDEGLTNPLNNDVPVMSLVESQLYIGNVVSASGVSTPVRVVAFPTTRYYIQDQYGTIMYEGEKVPEGTDASGAPIYHTYWFSTPQDYVQYRAPYTVGASKTTYYTKQQADGPNQKLGKTVTAVEAVEPVSTPAGNFDTYRVRLVESSENPGSVGTVLYSRTQNIYPDIGIVKFDFFSATPGDTGDIVMSLSGTNIPYLGDNYHSLAAGDQRPVVFVNQYTRFDRSGFYVDNDGTIEEIGGWFTLAIKDTGAVNPATGKPTLTIIETHQTDIDATDLAGTVTHTSTHQVFNRYVEIEPTGELAFVGDTGPNGSPVWFDKPFVPVPYPYFIGQTNSQTVTASTWANGQATPAYTYTPTMKTISIVPVRTKLGTFESYRMTYSDTNGYRAEQYEYPVLGVVRFSYPAPSGKQGHMDLTISSTNIPYN